MKPHTSGTVRPLAWIRERMWLVDALIAVGVFLYNLPIFPAYADGPLHGIALLLLSAVLCGSALVRRRRPLTALGTMLGAAIAHLLLGAPVLVADVMLLLGVYTVAARCDWRRSLTGAALTLGWLIAAIVPQLSLDYVNVGQLGVAVVVTLWVWTWGVLVRTRRQYIAGLQDRAEQAERERETNARIAVADERARIAREIHDVVSHGLGVVVVVSEGAASTVERDPERAKSAMLTVRDTGRSALADMRRMLGVLREDEPGSQSPQPGLEQISGLVERSRDAGLPITFTTDGDPAEVPEGVGLTAHRIVQECLTNVHRHAGPSLTTVEVRLALRSTALEVRVTDDGGGDSDDEGGPDGGFGLIGMRERVAGHGGTLTAGPRPDGGFDVTATLPWEGRP